MDIKKYLAELHQGIPHILELKNQSMAKITKLTLDDGYSEALYEIASTPPRVAHLKKEQLPFIYKKIVTYEELEDFMAENYDN